MTTTTTLADVFADALPLERRAEASSPALLVEIEGVLEQKLREARTAWPSFGVDDVTYVQHCAKHVGAIASSSSGDLKSATLALLAADLYLAVACIGGSAAALETLDEHVLRPAAADAVRSYRSLEVAEVEQVMREKVLVGRDGQEPKLASYAGRAALGAWFRVVAVHAAVSMTRRLKPHDTLEETSEVLASVVVGDAELAHLEGKYAAEFKAAFHDALAKLHERDRTLLRMHVLDQMGIDDLCKIHGVHRATAARWLVRIREELFAETRANLRQRLHLNEDELDDLVGVMLSRLDVSLERVLRPVGDNLSLRK